MSWKRTQKKNVKSPTQKAKSKNKCIVILKDNTKISCKKTNFQAKKAILKKNKKNLKFSTRKVINFILRKDYD